MKHNGWIKYGWGMAAVLLLFASCSRDGLPGDGDTLPEGKYPLALTAEMDGMKTRAAGKDAWTDGDEIGVRIGADGAAGRYKLNADGAEKEAVTPVYWQNSASATVKAWYPYADKTGIYINNQSNGYADYDFLTATAENQNYQTSVTLNFEHQMAKVKYILQAGNGITADELATAQVRIYGYWKISFSQGTLTLDNTNNSLITPVAASATEGEALLVPQNMAGKSFIKVTINGLSHVYKPKAGENAGNLEAGKAYTYTITVSAYGIEVKEVTGGTWSDGGNEAAAIPVAKYTASDVKPGDYLYTNGTTSDGGLRARYSNGFVRWETPKPTPLAGKTVSGIVFWTPSETDLTDTGRKTPARLTDDKIMTADFPKCTRGLAVALRDAANGTITRVTWQGTQMTGGYCESIAENFQNTALFTHERKSDFRSIASGTGEDDDVNRILGYQNTQVLRAYNKYNTENNRNLYKNNLVTLLEAFEQSNPAPQGSTGWFLPSAKEWHILYYKDVDNVCGVSGTDKKDTYDFVNSSLSAAGGELLSNDYYWSSTEGVDSNGKEAFIVMLTAGSVGPFEKYYPMWVRCICAF